VVDEPSEMHRISLSMVRARCSATKILPTVFQGRMCGDKRGPWAAGLMKEMSSGYHRTGTREGGEIAMLWFGIGSQCSFGGTVDEGSS
jgi:hypothetical protein